MKFIISVILYVLLISPAFACPESKCELGDALIQFGGDSFLVSCVKYNSSHDKWQVTKDGKEYLISTENSKVWNMDGELRKQIRNKKVLIESVPTFAYYVVRKDMSEPPVGVDEVGVSRDFIVTYTINVRGDRFKTIYPAFDYEVVTSYGMKINPK